MNFALNLVKVRFLLVLMLTHVERQGWFAYATTNDEIASLAFTQPLYQGAVDERSVSAVVQSEVMMGMWLNEANQDVQYQVMTESTSFQARRVILGNFIFLELQTTSLTETIDIQVQATSSRLNRVTFCTVQVQVKDINDFRPLFPPVPYSVSIPEDTRVGSTITHVVATDSDRSKENSRFYYSLPQLTSDYFAVHPTTGAVILTAPLNAEAQSVHSVAIQVTDRKALLARIAQPKTTILTVTVQTVNLHPPIISVHAMESFSLTKAQYSDSKVVYAVIKVSDPNSGAHGRVSSPRITHGNEQGLFAIEPRQKDNEYDLVIVGAPSELNDGINITIETSDRGTPPLSTSTVVSLKLSDEKRLVPIFNPPNKVVRVSEVSPIYTQIAFLRAEMAVSNKGANIWYTINAGNENKVFRINGNTSLVTLHKGLNRRSASAYNLTVCATYSRAVVSFRNCTNITVKVEDANDHDPVFTQDSYSVNISEIARIGSRLLQVEALDEDRGINGSVIYSLVGSEGLPFDINPFNGTIFTTQTLDADTLSKKVYQFRVRAHDQGVPFSRRSDALIIVNVLNVNDNAPVFSEEDCVVSLPVYTRINTLLIQLEPFDLDRDLVTCSLVLDSAKWFQIDQQNCAISLASSVRDLEVGDQLLLEVTASDGHCTSPSTTIRFKLVRSGLITKECRDTGAIRRFEETMNNLRLQTSREGENDQPKLNRSSQLLNKYSPRVYPRNAPLIISILEDIKLDSVVTHIRAIDRDTGYNGKLWFTIVSGNNDGRFWINTQTGVVTLVLPLDREQQSSYNLSIRVSDLGTPSKSTLVRVRIEILDVNDNAPTFERQLYTFDIPENTAAGYRLGRNIHAVDVDEGLNGVVRYEISSSNHHNNFFIDPVTGLINVTAPLDREVVPEFNLIITATDGALTNPLSSTVSVVIRLQDINDNSPKFYQELHRIRISEDLPVNTLIFWLQARDPDSGPNGLIRYSLTDGATDSNRGTQTRFRVDDRTGAIRLSSSLNARIQNRYNITARARDSGKLYSTCFIEIELIPVNRNLHAPYFDEQRTKFEISENAAIASRVGVVSATDEDTTHLEREIRYSIVDGDGLGVFQIDQNTGIITNTRALDRETQQFYWLTVMAEDMAPEPLSSHIFVLVEVTDVNDNVPQSEMPLYIFRVAESIPVRSSVGQIRAYDLDAGPAGRLSFRMSKNPRFGIESDSGIIRTRKRLNREDGAQMGLTFDVTISDSGSPPLSSLVRVMIILTDVNNNPPVFASFLHRTINLPARNSTLAPQPLTQVVAWDDDAGANGVVEYVLQNSRKFEIDSETGFISTEYGFRDGQRSVLKVTAADHGSPSLNSKFRLEIVWGPAPVFSSNPPVFPDSNMEEVYFEHVDVQYIPEKSSSGKVVRLLQASDVDSEHIWYQIVGGNEDNMFAISNDNALFVVGDPDAESKTIYNLTIQATDGYNQALKQLVVRIDDINDHRPAFTNQTFTAKIGENLPPNSHVIRLTATDGDLTPRNRNFIFRIRSASDPSSVAKFHITTSGDIYTSVELNREVQKEHVLTVEVDDQGIPGSLQDFCRVRIIVKDENEHPPQFSSSKYSGRLLLQVAPDIGVNEVDSDVVLQVQALDRDHGRNAKITYSIVEGNDNGYWKINTLSGEISANRTLILKSQIPPCRKFILIVKAQDGGRDPLFSTTQVEIGVTRNTTVPPHFVLNNISLSIPENVSPKSFVAKVTATSPHSVTYNFASGNSEEKFSINPSSGVISLLKALDREQQKGFTLVVVCTDSEGEKAKAHVNVHVTDVNDNRPVFTKISYTGYVETQNLNSPISVLTTKNEPLFVSAVDSDIGDNARLIYGIVDKDKDILEKFSVDQFSGAISFKQAEKNTNVPLLDQYEFKIQALDLGNPRLSSANFALITVYVTVSNKPILAFSQLHYNFTLYLPTIEGALVSSELSAKFYESRNPSFLAYSLFKKNSDSAFKVDPQNGDLLVADPTTLHSGNQYNLVVRANDESRFSTAGITVTVSSIPQATSLAFTQDVFEARIIENSLKMQPLVLVTVAATKLEDNFRFRILNPTPGLAIGFTTGIVQSTGLPLDREEIASYNLQVEAVDVASSEDEVKRGRCLVNVIVDDVNDNPPQFTRARYQAVVRKNFFDEARISQVKAVDFDYGNNGLLSYSLEKDSSGLFEIDASTGVVTLRGTPNFDLDDEPTKLNLTVIAQDMGEPPLQSSAFLAVSFVDEDSPVFTQQFYSAIAVSESAQSFTVVTDVIKATTPDDSDIFYTIEDGDPDKVFDIDFLEGTLISMGKFDRERQDKYRLRVRARSTNSNSFADAEAEISVRDANDNFPVFSKSSYSANLLETTQAQSRVIQVKASDADIGQNGEIKYSILENGEDRNDFYIDFDTGIIWTVRNFDAEIQSLFNFVVRASDSGVPSRHSDAMVTVTIDDVNDNPPNFEDVFFDFEISENARPGSFVGKISAWDLDVSDRLKLSYSTQDHFSFNFLRIESNTGIMTLEKSLEDMNMLSPVLFNVSATDGKFLSFAEVSLHIGLKNGDRELVVFDKSYNFTIFENQPANTEVGQVSTVDSETVSYSIISEALLSDFFRIDDDLGKITTTKSIDRESPEMFGRNRIKLQIMARDSKGSSAIESVDIDILDVNDNDPIFKLNKYNAVLIPSATNIGDFVVNVTALDRDQGLNGLVSYYWGENNDDTREYFRLDSQTGQITVAKILDNRVEDGFVQFFVEAKDHGKISRNNFVPVRIYFALDPDYVPVFQNSSAVVSVPENIPVGSEITVIQANVMRSSIRYSLGQPYVTDDVSSERNSSRHSESYPFAIDTFSGRITTISQLDREIRLAYYLTVLAYAEATPAVVSSAEIQINLIDINDNDPEIAVDVYRVSVLENSKPFANLVTVIATDNDQGNYGVISFSLEESDMETQSRFEINSQSGVVSVVGDLDREEHPTFDLIVTATDGGSDDGDNKRRTSTCHVIIDVMDVNDNPPQFSKQQYDYAISESAPVDHVTPKFVHVTDADDDVAAINVYIIDGDLSGHFRLNSRKTQIGENKLRVGLQLTQPLDREIEAFYNLTLLATDGFHNSTTQVRILVEDANDNPPICQQLTYYGSVSENSPLRTFVLRISTMDVNSGELGRIVYTLTGRHSDHFDLDPHTGQLFTAILLNRELISEYDLIATSSDTIGQSCLSQLRITIEDVNDNSPQFDASSLHANPRENQPVNSIFHRVVAHDPDNGENGSFTFSFTNTSNDQFYIEPETGVVILTKPLDRELVSSYDLSIEVSDKGDSGQLTTSSLLHIQVLDVNDNPPIFDTTQYKATVKENVLVGHVIEQVSARSLDIGANGRLRYTLVRGNEHNMFAINSDTGEVTVTSELDYESERSYVLKITASDLSDQPLSSECTLRIDVTDVNDNPPQFASPYYEVSLSEDTAIGYICITLQAIDKDSWSATNISYSLEPTDSPFEIDSNSGKLSLAPPGLDFETQKMHLLTVIATDAGQPPLSTQTAVNITVRDVNDNRPRFLVKAPPGGYSDALNCSPDGTNCTVFVHDGTLDPVQRGLVLLNATDADGEGNGAPFVFRLLNGDSFGLFYLDDSNILKSTKPLLLHESSDFSGSPFSKPKRLVHRIRIKVEDSGSLLRLSSNPDLLLNVIVIKESLYRPIMTPHQIQIALAPGTDEYTGNVLARKLHATDRDLYDRDRLRFSLASASDFERFLIEPLTGAISSTNPLPVGIHCIEVRVSDGSQFSISTIVINILELIPQALENSVYISFDVSSEEEYLLIYHLVFLENLRDLLPEGFNRSRDFAIFSLQTQKNITELFFGVRRPPSPSAESGREFYSAKSIGNILQKNRQLLEEKLGIRIQSIEGKSCDQDLCSYGKCEQIPIIKPLDDNVYLSVVSTDSFSLITSRFERIPTCVCPSGTMGAQCKPICSEENNACAKGETCTQDDSKQGYRCDASNRPNSIFSFKGKSLATFSLNQKLQNVPLQVAFKLRTFQSNATVFYATGPSFFCKLETQKGFLRYTFDIGKRTQSIVQDLKCVNDGRWYNVDIETTRDSLSNLYGFQLTLDEKYIATINSPNGEHNFNVTEITFGAEPTKTRAKRDADREKSSRVLSTGLVAAQFGFRGCIQKAQVNGESVSHNPKLGLKLTHKDGVTNRCSNNLIDMGACANNPCHNGGRCLPLMDGVHECDCPLLYDGDNCENLNLCGPIPCKNKGYCSTDGNDVKCHCSNGFTGDRCEISLVCQAIDECNNGGNCTADLSGQPSCLCVTGWTGQHCEIDINECATEAALIKCGGSEQCFNYQGGFACKCGETDVELRDPNCKFVRGSSEKPIPPPSSAKPQLFIIIAASAVAVILIIAVLTTVICLRRKVKKKKDARYRSGSRRSEDIAPVRNFSPSRYLQQQQLPPPQVPRRPSDYQRSPRDQLDFFNVEEQEQRERLVGLVHPQIPMATFSVSTAPSDSGSALKHPSLRQDYERSRFPESASSSFQHLPPSRKPSGSSASDQQGHLWDVIGLRPSGSAGLTPSVSSVPHQLNAMSWGRRGDIPSSPESQRSFWSNVSARRGHRSQRTDALPGHYNSGKMKRQKQLLQMIALKEKNEQENLQIQRVLSHLVSQELQDGGYYEEPDSRNSSMRSSLSRYRSSFRRQDRATGPTSSLVSSFSQSGTNKRSTDPRKAGVLDSASHSLGSSSDKTPDSDSSPSSGVELPPPPSEFELQALKEEDEGSTSHLAPPGVGNRHPSSSIHALHQTASDDPIRARSSHPTSSQKKSHHLSASSSSAYPPDSFQNRMPQEFDSHLDPSTSNFVENDNYRLPLSQGPNHRLPMSSLSEDEGEVLRPRRSRPKKTADKPRNQLVVRNRRMKKKLYGSANSNDVTSPEQEMTLLPVFDDVTS